MFNDVFSRSATRDAIAAWDGGGIDPSIVDLAGLRDAWADGAIGMRTALLLQRIALGPDRATS